MKHLTPDPKPESRRPGSSRRAASRTATVSLKNSSGKRRGPSADPQSLKNRSSAGPTVRRVGGRFRRQENIRDLRYFRLISPKRVTINSIRKRVRQKTHSGHFPVFREANAMARPRKTSTFRVSAGDYASDRKATRDKPEPRMTRGRPGASLDPHPGRTSERQ
jgi:hypothetical protein